MTNSTELGNRRLFHWRPPNPQGFVASTQPNDVRLADVIAEAVPRLFSRGGGSLCYLNDDDQIVGVTPDKLIRIIGEHIAYVRLVPHNGKWVRVYCEFEFPPRPRFNPTDLQPNEPAEWALSPDYKVLMELFSHLLPLRLPRVEA